jgi:hypothetical protein
MRTIDGKIFKEEINLIQVYQKRHNSCMGDYSGSLLKCKTNPNNQTTGTDHYTWVHCTPLLSIPLYFTLSTCAKIYWHLTEIISFKSLVPFFNWPKVIAGTWNVCMQNDFDFASSSSFHWQWALTDWVLQT